MSFNSTPIHDIYLLKEISWYERDVDALVGKSALKSFSNHLLYLVEEIMPLSLFSDEVTTEEKQKLAELLKSFDENKTFRSCHRANFEKNNFSQIK